MTGKNLYGKAVFNVKYTESVEYGCSIRAQGHIADMRYSVHSIGKGAACERSIMVDAKTNDDQDPNDSRLTDVIMARRNI